MTDVVWLKQKQLCWDQHLVASWLDDFEHFTDEIPGDGCVLVVPARYYDPATVNDLIAPLRWVLVILTSDEESTFDHRAITHPNMRLWVMTPRPGIHEAGEARYLGEGTPDGTADILAACADVALDRPVDVFFAGQATHQRRVDCLMAMADLDRLQVGAQPTEGFMQGMPRDEYLQLMAATKVAPCPSGPATPDSFRLFEALEAGCVPIADQLTPDPDYPDGYWNLVYGPVPFPVIEDWAELAKEVDAALEDWPRKSAECSAWWQGRKRADRLALRADITALSGEPFPTRAVDDRVTVLIPTSPIPSHPSLDIIATTIASVREQLPDAEILVVADGTRPELGARTPEYHEYLRRLCWACAHEWHNVTPIILPSWGHQANATRVALESVVTPLALFVEHDTPLEGDIDWEACAAAVESGRANLVRFHHESEVLDVHRHLMLDTEPQDVEGAPLLRTVQWSQRPHLASAGFYRSLIHEHFPPTSRTMVEDTMHSVVESAWQRWGEAGWAQFRLWMYAPEGNIRRSHHLDGRGTDPKFEMCR